MNKFIIIIVVLVVLSAAAMTGMFSQKNPEQSPVAPPVSCVDFDPPNSDEFIMYNGAKYDLIKKDGGIPVSKMPEMAKVGSYNGQDLYQLKSANYFGENKSDDIVYKLKEIKNNSDNKMSFGGEYIFDIYLKDKVQIPDFIKNCKSTGGQIAIVKGEENQFPPSAFNTVDIVGSTMTLSAPAYVYTGNKSNLNTIKGLAGAKEIGTLQVKIKNKFYPLYFHLDTIYLMDNQDQIAYEYLPTDKSVNLNEQAKKSLQLKKVDFITTPSYSWWTPECKPAIYLYPIKKTSVNVKVFPKGFFTLTIPQYPLIDGWKITAYPGGTIEQNGINYPYLYYESKIKDSEINKPKQGFVVKFYELKNLYNKVLTKLGLSSKEIDDFNNYWLKALPYSPYYFVGIMEEEDIEKIEPMTIVPKPDTMIRVRLYFEPLENMVKVEAPDLRSLVPGRIGFTVVEWGGMVKTDKNHPFTCSQ